MDFKKVFLIDQKKEILKELIPLENLEDATIKLHITTIDLESGEIIRFTKGKAISLCIASSAIVPLFKPITYQNYKLVDGGIMDNLPLTPLKQYGLPIVAVNLHPMEKIEIKKSLWSIIKRTILLVWYASVQNQIKECNYYITNKTLSTYSIFSFKKLDELFELGYQTACNHPLIKNL